MPSLVPSSLPVPLVTLTAGSLVSTLTQPTPWLLRRRREVSDIGSKRGGGWLWEDEGGRNCQKSLSRASVKQGLSVDCRSGKG